MSHTKEELEYHITDIGVTNALYMLKISEKEADILLNGKIYGESSRYKESFKIKDKKYVKLIMADSVDSDHLYRIISKSYSWLSKIKCRNKLTVNSRAMSSEDIFHESLLRILKNSDVFIYESDAKTINMINRAFKRLEIDEAKLCEIMLEKYDQIKNISQNDL